MLLAQLTEQWKLLNASGLSGLRNSRAFTGNRLVQDGQFDDRPDDAEQRDTLAHS